MRLAAVSLYRILLVAIVFSSCFPRKQNLEDRIIEYSKINNCEDIDGCRMDMNDVTWFTWDTMRIYEDEMGGHCDFTKDGNIVYEYFIRESINNSGVFHFGFGDQNLDSFYSSENCNFHLTVEQRQNYTHSKVYFILPLAKAK